MAGGRRRKEKNLLFDAGSWSHNRSVVFGKTDAQQTGKTIDHIKGKKQNRTKRFCLKPCSSVTCKKAVKCADQNGGLRSDQPQCKKQRSRVTLISLFSFAETYLKNYVFIVYVSHFPLNQSVCQSEYMQYSLIWVSFSLIYQCFGKTSCFSVCWNSVN